MRLHSSGSMSSGHVQVRPPLDVGKHRNRHPPLWCAHGFDPENSHNSSVWITQSICFVQRLLATLTVIYHSMYCIVGFNIPLDTLRSFRRRFYRSDDLTNSVIALKDDSLPGQGPIPTGSAH